MINNYKAMIKHLEGLGEAYQEIIENNSVLVTAAEEEVIDIVNKLIGKKEF